MVRFHVAWAEVLTQRNEYLDAAQECMEALKMAEKTGDIGAQAATLRLLGSVHWRKGDYHMSLEYIEQGMARARKVRDRELEGVMHTDKGNALNGLGDVEAAAGEYREAIRLLEGMDNPKELARAYNNLGDNFMRRQRWVEAAELFERTKAVARDDVLKGWGGFNRAECLVEMTMYDEARRELEESISHLEKVDDTYGLVGAFQILGLVEARTGHFDKAEAWFNRSLELSKPMGMPVSEAKVIRDVGRMYMWKGDRGRAREFFEQARAIFEEHGAGSDLATVKKDLLDLERL